MENNKIPFRVIRGKKENMLERIDDGILYFTTDTHQIYLGTNNRDAKELLMGYETGIFYGLKEIPVDGSGNAPDPDVIFTSNEIEGDRLPNVKDLILNQDGCFYRVTALIDDFTVKTTRLTLQGSGVGPGTGPGGASFSITVLNGLDKAFATNSESIPIDFISYHSDVTAGMENGKNYIQQVSFSFLNETEPFYSLTTNLEFNKNQSVDLYEVKQLFDSQKKTVRITIYDAFNNTRYTDFKIQLIDLKLEMTQNNILYTNSKNYTYSCNISGATSGVSEKYLMYEFWREHDHSDKPILSKKQSLDISTNGNTVPWLLDLLDLEHGIYDLKITAYTKISNSNTIISSNTLNHKMVNYTIKNSPLLTVIPTQEFEQYTETPLKYLLYTEESNKNYSLQIVFNNKTIDTINIQSNTVGEYPGVYFDQIGLFTLYFSILEENATNYLDVLIEEYDGEIPVINTNDSSFMLYLNPRGKSNDSVDKAIWNDYTNKPITANLSDFYFGSVNGWMKKNNVNYLKMSAGAKLTLPNFRPFQYDLTEFNNLNTQSGYGMTIELDFSVSNILDYDSQILSCVSKYEDGKALCGFELIGDKIYFYNNRMNTRESALSSFTIVENERIRLSYVIEPKSETYPMFLTYLNGKLSNAVFYSNEEGNKDRFVDNEVHQANFLIDSTNAEVNLYGIRIYSRAFNNQEILNNYTASFATLEEKEKHYKDNKVFNNNNNIDYNIVSSEEYFSRLKIPYMKLTGGYQTVGKEDKWRLKSPLTSAGLPNNKSDYRLVDVEVIYPDTKYFENYYVNNNGKYIFKNQFENGVTMAEASGQRPTNGGAIMYAQGTSSLEYPVKNLRIRFKNEEDYYQVRPDINPVEIICMKADYMESSGSHNTGAANLIDALYTEKTPGQAHFNATQDLEKEYGKIVTSIKGHPCLIFYSPDGNEYEYIGKYNLNLDKATPEPFGFIHDDSEFGYLQKGDTYYNENGEELQANLKEINSIHCFEFLDNTVPVCNFLKRDDTDNYEETWYNTFLNKDNELVPGWTLGFESRYPEDKVGSHDADALYPVASWLNELYVLSDTNEKEAIARFKAEYLNYFNSHYLLSYYIITDALLMADSRTKNMMIATWGKQERESLSYINFVINNEEEFLNNKQSLYKIDDNYNFVPLTDKDEYKQDEIYYMFKEREKNNNYIWYPIFYDMDTMLGLNNEGYQTFNYYDEDTTNSLIYNGEEVLWTFVRKALFNELQQTYDTFENKDILTASGLLPYFNDNQADLANEAFYNGDAKYKYIRPAVEGYVYIKDGKEQVAGAGKGPRLYALQGDRSLMRKNFITNRISLLRGKYNSTDFKSDDRIVTRWSAPDEVKNPLTQEDIRLNNSIKAVPPTGEFSFTSIKTGYSGVQLGQNGSIITKRFNGEETIPFALQDSKTAGGTETYLLGISNLSSLGDLSDKYLGLFDNKTGDNKLSVLQLGNSHKDYYNPNWSRLTTDLDLSNFNSLQEFNLQNCDTYVQSLSFLNCPAIQKIYLTGSKVSGISLPINGYLTELHLPSTIVSLTIKGHNQLTDENFSFGYYKYNDDTHIDQYKTSLPPEGHIKGEYINEFEELQTLEIHDTPINTHEIVKNAKKLSRYSLRNVNWTIEENYSINNGLTMLDENNNIVCIPALDYLLTITPLNGRHSEDLTGTILIKVPNSFVDELTIYNMYKENYPNLKIEYDKTVVQVKGAKKIEFYRVDKNTIDENNIDIQTLSPYYTALVSSNNEEITLAQLVNSNNFNQPTKSPTVSHNFEFTGEWIDLFDSNKASYYDDTLEGVEVPVGANKFTTYIPERDMKLVPVFKSVLRSYSLSLYDWDRTELLTNYSIPYGSDIGQYLKNNNYTCGYYNYRPYLQNQVDKTTFRFVFDGWQHEADIGKDTVNYSTLNEVLITRDLVLYAHYRKENYRTMHSDLKYFSEPTRDGYIGLATDYKTILRDEITLPKQYDNIIIKGIMADGFKNNTVITTIYFEDNNSYSTIDNRAFENCESLQYIELPDSITEIKQAAFLNCYNLQQASLREGKLPLALENIGLNAFGTDNLAKPVSIMIDELPNNLITIQGSAFFGCKNIKISTLPPNLKSIAAYAFGSCSNLNIREFGTIDSGPKLSYIYANAFNGAGSNVGGTVIVGRNLQPGESFITEYQLASDQTTAAGAFQSYGNNISVLKYYGNINNYGIADYSQFGFRLANNCEIQQEN